MALLAAQAASQGVRPTGPQATDALERTRIREARVAAQASFDAQEALCYQRFVVNDCLEEVRRTRRTLLADLRRQDLSLNEAQRKRRASEQLLRSDEKIPGR